MKSMGREVSRDGLIGLRLILAGDVCVLLLAQFFVASQDGPHCRLRIRRALMFSLVECGALVRSKKLNSIRPTAQIYGGNKKKSDEIKWLRNGFLWVVCVYKRTTISCVAAVDIGS